MAGFFGFFNYEKEGPGIAKDAPKKKTFIIFFEMLKINFWKFVPISFVYIILSLPIVTNGIANAGITNVARNTARDKHSFGMSDFFETIKKNWKQSLIAGIVNAVITVLAFFAARFYYRSYAQAESFLWLAGLGVTLSLLLLFTFAKYYIWTMIITFDLPLFTIYKNGFKLAIANLWRNFVVGTLLMLTYALYFCVVYFLPYAIAWVMAAFFAICTLPAYRFLMIQFAAFPAIKKYMIDPYYKEHPDLDIEKRKNLGLID
ncbi:MAG: DUF624 domain-containing protein [Clostridia bacterium]|nr:DUF624 domain-containing protein [Clostridia bacterium]